MPSKPNTASRAHSPSDPLYQAALRGGSAGDKAREALKQLKPSQRALISPTGLTGKAKVIFIRDGLTGPEQIAQAKNKREAAELAASITSPITDSLKEATMTTKSNSTRKPRTIKTPKGDTPTAVVKKTTSPKSLPKKAPAKVTEKPAGTSAAEVARIAKIDGRKFRAFLRSENIGRTFTSKADATKAVKAFKASQS